MSEDTVRLACVKHAASVHPEPGSNSPFYFGLFIQAPESFFFRLPVSSCFCYTTHGTLFQKLLSSSFAIFFLDEVVCKLSSYSFV